MALSEAPGRAHGRPMPESYSSTAYTGFRHRATDHTGTFPQHLPPSDSIASMAFPQSATVNNLSTRTGGQRRRSQTWTASSGDLALLSDTDEIEDRSAFLIEYNRLASKHGVKKCIPEDFAGRRKNNAEKRGWLQRLLRGAISNPNPRQSADTANANHPRHKRSVSDIAHNLIHNHREERRILSLQTMVRISGKSAFYLPIEHTPRSSLVLPTCIRATAHHLTRNVATRGIFRINGSKKVVDMLFDYYCVVEGHKGDLAGTVRCADLPLHIDSSVYDVASTFKKMLGVLQGGILGSLEVFDAMAKVRARLIALAILTIPSHFRRDLICSVFGLLSLIGRAAELALREDDMGRALPTSDLMGYTQLSICFGPLVVGDLIDEYSMHVATPVSGLMVLPIPNQITKRDKRKPKGIYPIHDIEKHHVANDITEMIITNWRDVVRQMRAIERHGPGYDADLLTQAVSIAPSTQNTFVLHKPSDWDKPRNELGPPANERATSPEIGTPTIVRRQRPSSLHSATTSRQVGPPHAGLLSPMMEESGTSGSSPGA